MKKIVSWILGFLLTGVVLFAGIFAFWYFGSTNYRLTGLPVLNYHQVNDRFQTVLTMKPQNFEEQIKYLYDNGYHSITQAQFDAYMKGEADLPDNPVMITFDDGYIDNYEQAYPILRKYGMTGTIFVITGLVGTKGYLTWPQIQEMSAHGMEFGSHTVSHRPLTGYDRQGMHRELTDSRTALERHVGSACTFIAFPEGMFNDAVMEETQATGYQYAFTVDTGRVFPWDTPYDLNRVPMFEGMNSYLHFRFRLTFSAFSAILWKMHRYFDHMEWSKAIAREIPQP